MDGHIRVSLGNIATIVIVAVLGGGITLGLLNYFAGENVPGVSHLSVGGLHYLNGKVAA